MSSRSQEEQKQHQPHPSSSSSSDPPRNPFMKAILYGPEHDRIQMVSDRTIPAIAAISNSRHRRVLVRVHSVGLNPVDAKDVMGDKIPHSWTFIRSVLRNRILHDKIPGFDFAGTVVETPSSNSSTPATANDSDEFHVGDEVFGTMPPFEGTLAEYIAAPVDQIYYKPRTLSWNEAAAYPLVGLTALQALQPLMISHVYRKKQATENDDQQISNTTTSRRRSSVLIIGGSGGTGHMAIQIAKRALKARHVTAICSSKSADFCRQMGADDIVDYTIDGGSGGSIIQQLQQSRGKPYDIVLDCVTSADPRDVQAINYPQLIQQQRHEQKDDTQSQILSDDYQYRRLGGQCTDWIRAGMERTVGLSCWKDQHEKLFWIQFPQSATQLLQLKQWAEEQTTTDHNEEGAAVVKPYVSQVYEFTRQGVRNAFDALLGRRVCGKVVVQIVPPLIPK